MFKILQEAQPSSNHEPIGEFEEYWEVLNYQVEQVQRFIISVAIKLEKTPIVHLLP
ncbi:unnamed protein product, partial [Adineta steineri]